MCYSYVFHQAPYTFSNDLWFYGHNHVSLGLNTLFNNHPKCGIQEQCTAGLLEASTLFSDFRNHRKPILIGVNSSENLGVTNQMIPMILLFGEFLFVNLDLDVRSSNDLLLRVNFIYENLAEPNLVSYYCLA